ncbi:MAG: hypothetical protein AAF560_17945 [Acidobacteriota bacterium]
MAIPAAHPTPPASRLQQLAAARRTVEAFKSRTRPQKELRTLLRVMIPEIQADFARPAKRGALEKWWLAVDTYVELLHSPLLAQTGGAKLLNEMLALTWRELEQPHLVRRVLKRAERLRRGRKLGKKGRRGRSKTGRGLH